MFHEFRLLVMVVEFVWNAVRAYGTTDAGQAELQAIENALSSAEAEGGVAPSSVEQFAATTLDEARAAMKRGKTS